MERDKVFERLEEIETQYERMFQQDIKVGETIRFGSIDGEPVEWLVLRIWKHEKKALVISKNAVEERAYHEEAESIIWEKCTLRKWLNGTFADGVLQLMDEEKARILTVNLQNEDNPKYGTTGGNSSWDRFFLLSIRAAKLYFKDDNDRVCYDKHGQETEWWWLRSPGHYVYYAAGVSDIGLVGQIGGFVHDDYVGVRPAFFLNLKS